MMKEEDIKEELETIEEYILKDNELKDLPNDFIGLINDNEIEKCHVIRGVLKFVLGFSGYK